jgi:hypothetical protein
LGKYRALVAENKALKEENARLKAKLDETKQWPLKPCQDSENNFPLELVATESADKNQQSALMNYVDPDKKIQLFMTLFKGRDDVYAKRWENKEGKAGYAPVCRNEWKSGLCGKPAAKCFDCSHRHTMN